MSWVPETVAQFKEPRNVLNSNQGFLMDIISIIIVALAGYLIGSISFARIITQIVKPGTDLDLARTRQSVTGEDGTISGIGAFTASIALGSKYGGWVSLLDMLKAFIPVLALRLIYPDQPYGLIFSIFAVIGHNFPIYYRFNGGRGLSPMLGSLIVIEPIGTVVAMLAGTVLGILINQPHTALLLWFPMLTIWTAFIRADIPVTIYTIILMILFIIADISELKLALEYRKQGRLDEYTEMLLESANMMQMIQKLSDRLRFWESKKPTSEKKSTAKNTGFDSGQ